MAEIVLSICFATYRRYEILKEMIDELLAVDSSEFEIVVTDNASNDGSVEMLREIQDTRLHIYENPENVGAMLNMYEALSKGTGKYLFYINDRDNLDAGKLEFLIERLKELDKKNVGFAKCIAVHNHDIPYRIYRAGKASLKMFACKIDHPTGYIYRKSNWDRLTNKKEFFENQKYGDYAHTQIAACIVQHYEGALLFGDMCDCSRLRVNPKEIKSGFYKERKDKRLWFTPEVQIRELKVASHFLEEMKLKKDVIDEILFLRYKEYIQRCTINFYETAKRPINSYHYNLLPPKERFWVPVFNGLHIFLCTLWFLICKNGVFIDKKNYLSKYLVVTYDTIKQYIKMRKTG